MKWVKAIIIGLVLSAVFLGGLFLFSSLMAQKVSVWQSAGAHLSVVQQVAVQTAMAVRRQFFFLAATIPILFMAGFLIIAFFKDDKN